MARRRPKRRPNHWRWRMSRSCLLQRYRHRWSLYRHRWVLTSIGRYHLHPARRTESRSRPVTRTPTRTSATPRRTATTRCSAMLTRSTGSSRRWRRSRCRSARRHRLLEQHRLCRSLSKLGRLGAPSGAERRRWTARSCHPCADHRRLLERPSGDALRSPTTRRRRWPSDRERSRAKRRS